MDGYDSASYIDAKGFQNLLVMDPFPMVAACRLTLTQAQLKALASQLRGLQPQNLEPRPVIFSPPSHAYTAFSTMTPNTSNYGGGGDDDDDDVDDDGEIEQEALLRLVGTEFEGYPLLLKWSGGIDLGEHIPKSVEKNLMKKLKFVNPGAPAFAGLKLVRTLLKREKMEMLNLLEAAESVSLSRKYARKSLNKYKCVVEGTKDAKLHPWALIVAARLEDDAAVAKKLLSTYSHLFPFQELYLSKEEREVLRGLVEPAEITAPDAHSILLQQWNGLRAAYPGEVDSSATDELLKLTGLRKVKEEAIRLWKTALQLKRMDDDTRKENQMTANYCFLGNPGTGKTTVARLFARILCDAGIRTARTIKETTAQQAKNDGPDKFREVVGTAMGGVLFIDEAYDLDPIGDSAGKPIVNELLTLCENDRDNISVILAGYEDEFQKKFFAYNDGLKSRFREVLFEDFDEVELSKIWTDMRTKKQWCEDQHVCSVAVKRIAKMSGKKGFGNAREVRRRLEDATRSAMARLGQAFSQANMILKIEDVIGEDPRLSNEKLQLVLKAVDEKIGWKRVKDKVTQLIELCGTNYQRELLGKPPFQVFLSRMFLGSPGTGKTTGAQLYGKLLKELGFLSNGDVVAKTASDFVGEHIGQSQKQTNQILESARGKVLIVDEAYALNDSMYGKQVLDTLVEKVQGTPSDDIAVLLLGYESEMLKMLQEQNPGLTRRFPKEHAFYFDDYDDNELLAILELNLKSSDVEATMAFREKALDVLRIQRKQANFGNAGSVELLVKGASLKAAKRANPSESTLILDDSDVDDPGSARAEKDSDPLSQLDKLYRMEKVKSKLDKMRKDWEVQRREGEEDPELGHFVFLGSPGTGKTTVARTIASILYSLGLLGSNKIVETSALDLTAEYIGQTKTKVEDKLKEAKGGVLFIDEAYNLGQGLYGKDACDTLVAAMTSEEFKDVLICIAGYPNEINTMLNANSGLKSRFTHYFQFPDWEAEDCVSFFKFKADEESFEIDDGVLDAVHEGCGRIRQLKGWGNGRDLLKLWKETKSNRAERIYALDELEKQIKLEDVRTALATLTQARIGKLSDSSLDADPLAELDSLFRMESIKEKLQRLQKTWAVSKREGDGTPSIGSFVFTGSPGTGKTTVARAISRVLFGLQLKPSDKLVVTSALDLQGKWCGHTADKVNELLGEAKGGCLFIDEAYNLGVGHFGKEALDALVDGMTSEEFKDVHIIIAGYPHEIDEMFKANPGFKSRFNNFFEFPDWRPNDCVAFFQHSAKKESFEALDDALLDVIRDGFEQLVKLEGFANGRDVKSLYDEAKSHRADRVFDHPQNTKVLLLQDVQGAMTSMLQSRLPKPRRRQPKAALSSPASPLPDSIRQVATIDPSADAPQNGASFSRKRESQETATNTASDKSKAEQQHTANDYQRDTALEEAEDIDNEEDKESVSSDPSSIHSETCSCPDPREEDDRDDGVPDDVWAELQAAKEKERQDELKLEKLRSDSDAAFRREEDARRVYETDLKRLQEELKRRRQEEARRKAEEEETRRRQEEEIKRIQEEEKRVKEEKEVERRRQAELELKRLEEERRRLEEEERRRKEEEERRRRQAELEQKRREEQLRHMEERKREKEKMKERLRKISKCPAGFEWYRQGSGWRCGGGSHYVSDEQLHRQFGYDA